MWHWRHSSFIFPNYSIIEYMFSGAEEHFSIWGINSSNFKNTNGVFEHEICGKFYLVN